jgi:hypothetical protein
MKIELYHLVFGKWTANWRRTVFGYLIFLSIILSGCSGTEPEADKSKAVSQKRMESAKNHLKTDLIKKRLMAENPLNQVFIGTWIAEDSTVEFTIDLQNGDVVFSGMDTDDRERIEITAIDWDKSTFYSSFITPSTMHAVNVKLSILDENSLRCDYFGDSTGEAIWLRK